MMSKADVYTSRVRISIQHAPRYHTTYLQSHLFILEGACEKLDESVEPFKEPGADSPCLLVAVGTREDSTGEDKHEDTIKRV